VKTYTNYTNVPEALDLQAFERCANYTCTCTQPTPQTTPCPHHTVLLSSVLPINTGQKLVGDNRFRRIFKENLKEMLCKAASPFKGQKRARWQHLPENSRQISFQPFHLTKDSYCAADNHFSEKTLRIYSRAPNTDTT